MPITKPISDLQNNYNEISNYCHTHPEPVFITKNEKCDLAVMSIETYENLTCHVELYGVLKEGLDDIENGNTRPFSDAISSMRSKHE